MAFKLIVVVLALLAGWFMLARAIRGNARPERKPDRKPPVTEQLEPCPRCGVYRQPGSPCNCDR